MMPKNGRQVQYISTWQHPSLKTIRRISTYLIHLDIQNMYPEEARGMIVKLLLGLPSTINQNNKDYRAEYIHPLFVLACREAGFIIHAEYECSMKAIRFGCKLKKYHNESKKKKYQADRPRDVRDPTQPPIPRERKTQLPLKHDDDDKVEECLRIPVESKFKTCLVGSTYWFVTAKSSPSMATGADMCIGF